MDIKTQYEDALVRVRELQSTPGSEAQLRLYSLYKQASAGDCGASRPGPMDFMARARWESWNGLKGMSNQEAMELYVEYVRSLGA